MNGKSLGLCGPQGKQKDCVITVDSGTTFASVPGWAYNEIMGKVPTLDNGVDCKSEEDFGKLTWVINGKEYSMEANEWVYPPAQYQGNTPVLNQMSSSASQDIQDMQEEEKDFIQLGQVDMIEQQFQVQLNNRQMSQANKIKSDSLQLAQINSYSKSKVDSGAGH